MTWHGLVYAVHFVYTIHQHDVCFRLCYLSAIVTFPSVPLRASFHVDRICIHIYEARMMDAKQSLMNSLYNQLHFSVRLVLCTPVYWGGCDVNLLHMMLSRGLPYLVLQ